MFVYHYMTLCQNKTQHHDKYSEARTTILLERAIDQIRHVSIESDRPQLSLAGFISHSDTDADPISSEMTISRPLHPQRLALPSQVRQTLIKHHQVRT